jgi:signal transduction histidine kinase
MKEFSHPSRTEKSATDLNKSIDTTVTVARNEWKYVSDVSTEFDANLPLVPCFVGEFNQVILNLIVNAAHAIKDADHGAAEHKGVITIRTRLDGDWAEIQVEDTGSGIPSEIRDRIFDPFFTTKEVGKGTGQGLSVARTVVVEKHGGTIHFTTELGKGTTFVVRLPINPAPPVEGEVEKANPSGR